MAEAPRDSDEAEPPEQGPVPGLRAASLLRELTYLAAPGLFAGLTAALALALLAALLAPGAVAWLRPGDWPLPVFEASHFLTSFACTLLLVLSFGLNQRLRIAWVATLFVYVATAGLALAAGRHIAFGAVFIIGALALVAVGKAFYRRGALRDVVLSPERIILILAALGGVAWLGFFAYRNVDYRHDLWWTFAVDNDASRFLRALVISVATLVLFAVWRVMQPSRSPPMAEWSEAMAARIQNLLQATRSERPDAALAFLGDKVLRFAEDDGAMLMFGARGRNWIVMGPPVGEPKSARALAFAIRREADAVRANLIFYAVPLSFLPLALDLGLSAQKIGETAMIDLAEFALAGKGRQRLRQTVNRLQREGCTFEVLPAGAFDTLAEDLARVSDAWLRSRHGEEKRFSLGKFDPGYLRRFPIALVRKSGTLCAFANVWRSADGQHCSIDLMRHEPGSPPGVMDYLIVQMALWAKEEGMQTLDLGMAPLSGLASERDADPLSRLGALIYSNGETFYGFEGLRQFKDKFHPRWEPVFLAGPDRVSLATAMADVALLTSGGLRGLLRRA